MCRISFISFGPPKRPSSHITTSTNARRALLRRRVSRCYYPFSLWSLKFPLQLLQEKKKRKNHFAETVTTARNRRVQNESSSRCFLFLLICQNCDTNETPYASTAAAHSQRSCRTALMNGIENGTICTRDRRHRHITDEKSTFEAKKRIFFIVFGNAHSGPLTAHTQHITISLTCESFWMNRVRLLSTRLRHKMKAIRIAHTSVLSSSGSRRSACGISSSPGNKSFHLFSICYVTRLCSVHGRDVTKRSTKSKAK